MSKLREALEYLEGARFENYSGQVIAEHDNKSKDYIVFGLTCVCGEVASKNADEVGEVLVSVLNGAREALEQRDELLAACILAEAELERQRQAQQEQADEESDELRRGIYQVPPTPALSTVRAAIAKARGKGP